MAIEYEVRVWQSSYHRLPDTTTVLASIEAVSNTASQPVGFRWSHLRTKRGDYYVTVAIGSLNTIPHLMMSEIKAARDVPAALFLTTVHLP